MNTVNGDSNIYERFAQIPSEEDNPMDTALQADVLPRLTVAALCTCYGDSYYDGK